MMLPNAFSGEEPCKPLIIIVISNEKLIDHITAYKRNYLLYDKVIRVFFFKKKSILKLVHAIYLHIKDLVSTN